MILATIIQGLQLMDKECDFIQFYNNNTRASTKQFSKHALANGA